MHLGGDLVGGDVLDALGREATLVRAHLLELGLTLLGRHCRLASDQLVPKVAQQPALHRGAERA